MSAQAPAAANAAAPAAPSKKKKLIGALLILLLVGGAGAGGYWWSQKQAAHAPAATAKKPERLPAQYFAIEPAFVVNLADADETRYLQADVQLMTRDPETLTALQTHAPAVRNRLLLLLGQQTVEQLGQRAAKERLQERALSEVRAVLKGENAPDKIEAVLFTSLVTQ